MSTTTSNLTTPRDEILQAYLARVQKEDEAGKESDEALSSDDEEDYDEDDMMGKRSGSSRPASAMDAMDLGPFRADDITSDDDAFSSEDEFGEEDHRDEQRRRKELALGRVPPGMFEWRTKDLVAEVEMYMKDLDDADLQYAELDGHPADRILRHSGPGVVDVDAEERAYPPDDIAAIVVELRKRSHEELFDQRGKDLVHDLVLLAQALFRKEREIKKIRNRLIPEEAQDEDHVMKVEDDE